MFFAKVGIAAALLRQKAESQQKQLLFASALDSVLFFHYRDFLFESMVDKFFHLA